MSESEPPISLEQLAGITAALAEKIPLADVLEQEQVEEAHFRAGERVWRERIAESLPTQLEYTQSYRVAQDCLARTLSPVEDDPAAWVGLLAAVATSHDQAELLGGLGITMNDVGRLGREWKRRAQKDPALGAQLAELAKSAKHPDKITAGPVELRPFPWTPKEKRRPVPAPPPPPEELRAAELDLAAGAPVQRVLASFQVKEHAPLPIAPPPASSPPAPSAPPVPIAPSYDSWTLEHYARLAWELRASPIDPDAVMQRYGLTTPESRRAIHEHFRRRFDSEPGLRAQFDAWLAGAARKARAAARRGSTDEIDHRALLNAPTPFPASAKPNEPKRDPHPPASPQRAGEKAAEPGASIADVLARMKTAFPSQPSSDGAQAKEGSGLAATATMDDGPSPSGPALPFEPGPATPPAPFFGRKKQSGKTVSFPTPLGLSLEQYAVLCSDLASGELPEAQVLAAASLTGEAREVLDSYWLPRLQAESDLRAEWQYYMGRRAAERQRR
ncbi:MAG: hypothetical protein IPM79_33810 [Polyangiaceae bacterium]|nr:hypothetical protein [Polyangiaceae bacterium]MBK8942441.1 hypothetical protein [Polyangiaceae bacterium]